jgi:hypothetical protein
MWEAPPDFADIGTDGEIGAAAFECRNEHSAGNMLKSIGMVQLPGEVNDVRSVEPDDPNSDVFGFC